MNIKRVCKELNIKARESPVDVDVFVLIDGKYRKVKTINQFSAISDVVMEVE